MPRVPRDPFDDQFTLPTNRRIHLTPICSVPRFARGPVCRQTVAYVVTSPDGVDIATGKPAPTRHEPACAEHVQPFLGTRGAYIIRPWDPVADPPRLCPGRSPLDGPCEMGYMAQKAGDRCHECAPKPPRTDGPPRPELY